MSSVRTPAGTVATPASTADVRLAERLSAMPVEIEYTPTASSEAWRSDWPAVAAADRRTVDAK